MTQATAPLESLKGSWNAVLDHLLQENRIAWLAYFDARLAALENGVLTLSFTDSEKFVGGHDFKQARNPEHRAALQRAIAAVTSINCEIHEERFA